MINWPVFFTNRYNLRLLKAFAVGQLTVRDLALQVNTTAAKSEAYRIANTVGTQYGRRLARKALKRRAPELVYQYV